jgi:uncharacterized protein (DUF736 family)
MENKINTGAMFANKKKTEEKHPNARGTINVDGREWEIAAWVKTDKNGNKYYSLAVSEPYKKDEAKPASPAVDEPENEDLPF